MCEIKSLNKIFLKKKKIYDLINKDVILPRVDGKMQVVSDPPGMLRTTDLRSKFSTHRTVHCLAANTQRMMQNSLRTLTQNFKVAAYREVDCQRLERACQGNHPHPPSHSCQSKHLITRSHGHLVNSSC